MLLGHVHDALAIGAVSERFAAAQDDETRAPQGLSLADDPIEGGPFQLFRGGARIRIAPCAAQVAGLGRTDGQKTGRRSILVTSLETDLGRLLTLLNQQALHQDLAHAVEGSWTEAILGQGARDGPRDRQADGRSVVRDAGQFLAAHLVCVGPVVQPSFGAAHERAAHGRHMRQCRARGCQRRRCRSQ